MKTAVITGASGEIGASIAKKLASAGYNVVIGYNENKNSAYELCERINASASNINVKAICIKADVKNEEEINSLFAKVESEFGKVDLLVNNAGISSFGLLTDMSLDMWNEVLAVNLTSVFLCSKRALSSMIKNKSGCIINISSVWGEIGASCEVAYSASKAGIIGFTKALSKEEGPSGIRVNCIAPGIIDTKMNDRLTAEEKSNFCEDISLQRMGKAEDVASAVLFLAENEYITGEVLGVNGGQI